MKPFRQVINILAATLLWAIASGAWAQATAAIDFDLPAQPLETSLRQIADTQKLQIVYVRSDLAGIQAPALKAKVTPREAIERLIEGTSLVASFNGANGVVIKKKTGDKVSEAVVEGAGRGPSSSSDVHKAEAIMVTAQKREQRAQDVPISVAVIGEREIERRGFIGMEDYLRAVPGVSQIDRGVTDNAIVIRGITTSPQGENFASGATVATYFGETSITGAGGYIVGGIDLRPVDLERIEVLRGPQGTTFGSASLAGAVRLIPNAPQLDRLSAKVAADYSRTGGYGSDNYMAQGVLNLPIVEDRFAVRLVGYRYEESGAYRNIVGIDPPSLAIANRFGVGSFVTGLVQDDIGSQLSTGGRIAALWRASDVLRVRLNYLTQKVEGHGLALANVSTYDQAQFPIAPIRQVSGFAGEYFASKMDLVNAVVDYELPWGTLTTTASYVDSGVSPNNVSGALPFPLTGATYMDVKSRTAEMRLASRPGRRIEYIAGAYWENTDNDNVQYTDWLGAGTAAPNPLPALNLLATDPTQVITTNRSVSQRAMFGELSYGITNVLTATVGGRYFEYEKSEYRLAEGGVLRIPFGTGVPTDISNRENGHTLKANLSYRPVDDTLVYASWSQGFRLGRPTAGVSQLTCDVNRDGLIDGTGVTIESTRTVKSDYLDSSEVGAKLALLDQRFILDMAAYHQKWTGLAIQVALPNVSPCFGTYTANAGEAKSDGVEFQSSLRLFDGLRVSLGAGYTNAELTKDAPSLGAPKGTRLPGAPRLNANLGAQYDFRVSGRRAFVRADAFYAGTFYGDLLQTPGLKAGGYTRVDARAGIALNSLAVELFVKNLTNQDDFTWRGVSGGANPFFGYRLRPRTVGVHLAYSFN